MRKYERRMKLCAVLLAVLAAASAVRFYMFFQLCMI